MGASKPNKVLTPVAAKRKPPAAGMGRKKGVPNKITRDVREMIHGALQAAGGQDYLTEQARENPAAFLALVGKTLPKEVKLDGQMMLEVNLVPLAAALK